MHAAWRVVRNTGAGLALMAVFIGVMAAVLIPLGLLVGKLWLWLLLLAGVPHINDRLWWLPVVAIAVYGLKLAHDVGRDLINWRD